MQESSFGLYAFFAVLMLLWSIPLALRKVKPNRWWGFANRTALDRIDYWYGINEYGGRVMIVAALVILAAGVGLPALGIRGSNYTTLMTGVFILTISLAFFAVHRFMKRHIPDYKG
jgi:hypothetical protein